MLLLSLTDQFGSGLPTFDVIFLGIGDDGHTASLFPGGEYLLNSLDAVLETIAPKPPFRRLSLGPAVIRSAKRIVSVLAGRGKESIAARILANDLSLPFCAITANHPDHCLWLDNKLSSMH